MRFSFTANQGVSLESKSLPNGALIAGILIDNPGGQWLYVVSEQQYIPPYTIGWSMPLSYEQASITVKSGISPAGQVGTIQGDAWTLTLDSTPVSVSAGGPTSQFIQQFTPQFNANVSLLARTSIATSAAILPSNTSKRYRLTQVFVNTFNAGTPKTDFIVPWNLAQPGNIVINGCLISRDRESEFMSFSNGLDAPGGGLAMVFQCDPSFISDVHVFCTVYYQLI